MDFGSEGGNCASDRSEIGNKELLFAWADNSPHTTKRFLFDGGTEADIFGVRRLPAPRRPDPARRLVRAQVGRRRRLQPP
jgi:hypothetical protein